MRVLIIGSSGMLGHQLAIQLTQHEKIELYCCARYHDKKLVSLLSDCKFLTTPQISSNQLAELISQVRPHFVLNCVGMIKQIKNYMIEEMIYLNATIPHVLESLALKYNANLIHFSTDCVFSGDIGLYGESDRADALDLYGRSKLLGEISESAHTLTLRTSIIGHELRGKRSLLEWFLNSDEKSVDGFANAIFSGQTTVDLARKVSEILLKSKFKPGLYNCGSAPINKFELLSLVNEIYSRHKFINKINKPAIDRSLSLKRFSSVFGIEPTDWRQQIIEMRQEYEKVKIIYE